MARDPCYGAWCEWCVAQGAWQALQVLACAAVPVSNCVLSRVGAGRDANRERLGSEARVLAAIVAALGAHVDSADVQTAGLRALQLLAFHSGTYGLSASELGARRQRLGVMV